MSTRSFSIPIAPGASPEIVALARDVERYVTDTFRGGPLPLKSYTVAGLPDPAKWPDCHVIVSNEIGGRTIATSDATNWRRVKDGAIVS